MRLPTRPYLVLLYTVQSEIVKCIEATGSVAPWLFLVLFLLASFLMIWRLENMAKSGLEGTILGTLVMPYCSGIGNLIFAYVLGRQGGEASEVMTNCLVNNVTNMTFILGFPAIFWNMSIIPQKQDNNGKGKKKKKKKKEPKSSQNVYKLNKLSLLLTLIAVLFFTGATWIVGGDGKIDFADGIVLVGIFLFWQCFHVFEVLKGNVQQNRSFDWMLAVDLLLLGVGAFAVYISTDWLVAYVSKIHTGFISAKYIGWLSGWLMVVPNGMLAIYYAITKRPEVVYTSQVGDGHICIPLCIGIFALFKSITMPQFFQAGMLLLVGATVVHLLFVGFFNRLPRLAGLGLTAAYGYFLYKGLLK
ncbi:sodium/calcium exchanger membrane region [Pedosphaera parvula]|uniref:Sodium/calcium exchanger membrane region n=1 Tax=Pedosphaera parvula (strain Ellin514) TaxID=320771 RepID=B9XIF5_PEDPL|nr:sodium/calcium exchanger membrane region [Pedosphaera parvula]EEF60416.1 sodium/calcium exchanger membrane region [Pedosphaera parvula Ellin514]